LVFGWESCGRIFASIPLSKHREETWLETSSDVKDGWREKGCVAKDDLRPDEPETRQASPPRSASVFVLARTRLWTLMISIKAIMPGPIQRGQVSLKFMIADFP
jgi:hypothetical protein